MELGFRVRAAADACQSYLNFGCSLSVFFRVSNRKWLTGFHRQYIFSCEPSGSFFMFSIGYSCANKRHSSTCSRVKAICPNYICRCISVLTLASAPKNISVFIRCWYSRITHQ